MKVPYQLSRASAPRAALAALVPGRDASRLLELCQSLNLDPTGRVFAVPDGLLLTLEAPTRGPIPGASRLRALGVNLYVPVDAELTPALLDDEADALGRDRGLVFLPGGRVLGFDPQAPLDPAAWLEAPRAPRRDWRPLPASPFLAPRIDEILIDRPEETPESILDVPESGDPGQDGASSQGGEGGQDSSLGKLSYGVGKGLAGLGKFLSSDKLSAAGANFINKALGMSPELAERVLGKQSAALRELVRAFREGRVDEALRKALPLGGSGSARGAGLYRGDALQSRDFTYSLRGMLDGGSSGGSSFWGGDFDVMAELIREYHKAAHEALERGDFRRAAVIYGKLLRDYSTAAQALIRGGMHHDAAVILLLKLDDKLGAARQFEAAGEHDRAVALYRQAGDHVAAGDLLGRLGEDEAALEEYLIAAAEMAEGPHAQLGAGKFMLNKVGRPDLAQEYFLKGWACRPAPNSVGCGEEAAKLFAELADVKSLSGLIGEASTFLLERETSTVAAGFYRSMATVADHPKLAEAREDLRDQVLAALAGVMRREARPGKNVAELVPLLLGRSGQWGDPQVSDAAFAAAAAAKPRQAASKPAEESPAGPRSRRFRVASGAVTAVTSATDSGLVFLGCDDGTVFAFDPRNCEVYPIPNHASATAASPSPSPSVASLATSPEGDRLVILRVAPSGFGILSYCQRVTDEGFWTRCFTPRHYLVHPWLTQISSMTCFSGRRFVGLWSGEDFSVLDCDGLIASNALGPPAEFQGRPTAGLLLESDESGPVPTVLLHEGDGWTRFGHEDPSHSVGLQWNPALPESSTLRSVLLSWGFFGANDFLVAGFDEEGTVRCALFEQGNLSRTYARSGDGGDLAVCVIRESLIAVVTRAEILWLRPSHSRLEGWRRTNIKIPNVVGAFHSPATKELVVVGSDGYVSRVEIPR